MTPGRKNGERETRLTLPPVVSDWYDEQAGAAFISRAAYCRQLLIANYTRANRPKEQTA